MHTVSCDTHSRPVTSPLTLHVACRHVSSPDLDQRMTLLTSSSQDPVTKLLLSNWLVSYCGIHLTFETFFEINFPEPTVILIKPGNFYLSVTFSGSESSCI